MKKMLLRDCMRIAKDKLPMHPQFEFYAHYSFILQDNKIIEWATNSEGEPPKHFGYHERIHHGLPKTHAEFNAYRKAKGLLDPMKSFECINIRLNKRSEAKISAPCSCCSNFLVALGCKSCYFTTDIGWAKINF